MLSHPARIVTAGATQGPTPGHGPRTGKESDDVIDFLEIVVFLVVAPILVFSFVVMFALLGFIGIALLISIPILALGFLAA